MIQINLVRNEFIYGNFLPQKLKTAMTVRKSVLPLAANMNLVEQEIMDVKLKNDHFNLKMIISHIFWRKYEIFQFVTAHPSLNYAFIPYPPILK